MIIYMIIGPQGFLRMGDVLNDRKGCVLKAVAVGSKSPASPMPQSQSYTLGKRGRRERGPSKANHCPHW